TYVVCTYDGTAWNLYLNGAQVSQTITNQGAIDWAAPWAIGDGTIAANTRYFLGNITEVALYTNALSASQVALHYYVGENGPIPNNSVPVIYSQPASQSAFSGGTVQFQVAAVTPAGSPITSYQWYFNTNTLLADATNAILTLNNVKSANAGYYTVVVGNANGTTNSAAASFNINTSSITIFGSDFDGDAGEGNYSSQGSTAYAGGYSVGIINAGILPNIGVNNTSASAIEADLSALPNDYSGVSYLGVRNITSYSAPISPLAPTANLSDFVLSFDIQVSGLEPNLTNAPVDVYNLNFNSGGTTVFNFSTQYGGFLKVGTNFTHFSIPLSQIPYLGGSQPVSAFTNASVLASINGFTLDFLESAENVYDTTNPPASIVVDNVQLVQNPPTPVVPLVEKLIMQANYDTTFPTTNGSTIFQQNYPNQPGTVVLDVGGGVGGSTALKGIFDDSSWSSLPPNPTYQGFALYAIQNGLPYVLTSSNASSYRFYIAAKTGGLLPGVTSVGSVVGDLQFKTGDTTVFETQTSIGNVSSNYTSYVINPAASDSVPYNGGSQASFDANVANVNSIQVGVQINSVIGSYGYENDITADIDNIKVVQFVPGLPPVTVTNANGHVQVYWSDPASPATGSAQLQSATVVTGPYVNVNGAASAASSPYVVPSGSKAQFFRTVWLPN
ncbi:MAG TPA: LamG-like jellyroll fold domain-containing protein, partial [Candidatus Acidoferrum sp.]|nr:LamG-like jellyroll fold domain-containing protein [Candidatus Acidoferrum sp.]